MVGYFLNKINSYSVIDNKGFSFFAASFCKFLFGFYISIIGSLLIPIGQLFDINFKAQTFIFQFNYLGQFIIIFFIGYLSDRFGKKIMQSSLLILFGITSILFTVADFYIVFLVLFLLMGIFGSAVNAVSDSVVSDLFTKNRGFFINLTHLFFALGGMTAPLVFNLMMRGSGDFKNIYWVISGITLLFLILVSLSKYPTKKPADASFKYILSLVKNKRILILCILFGLALGTQLAVAGWIPTLFQRNLSMSSELSNYSLSFFWLAIAAGRIVTAFLTRKFSELSLLLSSIISISVILIVSFFLNNYISLLIAYVLTGYAIGGFVPLIVSQSAKISIKNSGMRIAVIFAAGAAGSFLVPTFIGILADYFLIYKVVPFLSVAFISFFFILKKVFK